MVGARKHDDLEYALRLRGIRSCLNAIDDLMHIHGHNLHPWLGVKRVSTETGACSSRRQEPTN